MTIATLLLALIVTTAADTPDGEPVLYDFHAEWCGPCKSMRPEVAKLARNNYPIKSVDIDRSREIAERFQVTAVPTFIVADSNGRVLARTQGVIPAAKLAAFYNDAVAQAEPTAAAPPRRETQATADHSAANPLPWETVVRIKMHLSSSQWGFGSGTVIYSDAEESIILTCAHIFRDAKGQATPLKSFRTKITVDLFDGKIPDYSKPQLKCIEENIVGEAIDYDFNNDVGLIRIHPGRVLPASKVVADTWEPRRGLKMRSVGCSHGNDATAWDTRILDPKVKMMSGNKSFYEMKCENQPIEGRSGGGLYTTDGYVAGVCDFADPNEKVGLYAVPSAIHRILDRNQLTALYKPSAGGDGRLLAATNRKGTRVALQSEDDSAVPTQTGKLTLPDPGMLGIAPPGTQVAAINPRPDPWRDAAAVENPRTRRVNRRPELEQGAALDPGPKLGATMTTDLALEPSSESLALDAPETAPAARTPEPAANTVPARSSTGKWKPVPSNRTRVGSPD